MPVSIEPPPFEPDLLPLAVVDEPIWVTTGCPCSVGPEVAVVAVRVARDRGIDCRLIGDLGSVIDACEHRGIDSSLLRPILLDDPHAFMDATGSSPVPATIVSDVDSASDSSSGQQDAGTIPLLCPSAPLAAEDRVAGHPTAASGRAQLHFLRCCVRLATTRKARAIVTGPVSKHVIATCGDPDAASFRGHTEYFASQLGATHPVMMFVSDRYTVALVTTHLPLRSVADALTIDNVCTTIVQCTRVLVCLKKRVRMAVASLNPHAGEDGMFGNEEQTVIGPAIEAARCRITSRAAHVTIDGPVGAETAFRLAAEGTYDAVVAMYHDQGTIPMKLGAFGSAVNVTAGLPILRTSVDHGTAYDIAGKGVANAGSMLQAIRLAHRLTQRQGE